MDLLFPGLAKTACRISEDHKSANLETERLSVRLTLLGVLHG